MYLRTKQVMKKFPSLFSSPVSNIHILQATTHGQGTDNYNNFASNSISSASIENSITTTSSHETPSATRNAFTEIIAIVVAIVSVFLIILIATFSLLYKRHKDTKSRWKYVNREPPNRHEIDSQNAHNVTGQNHSSAHSASTPKSHDAADINIALYAMPDKSGKHRRLSDDGHSGNIQQETLAVDPSETPPSSPLYAQCDGYDSSRPSEEGSRLGNTAMTIYERPDEGRLSENHSRDSGQTDELISDMYVLYAQVDEKDKNGKKDSTALIWQKEASDKSDM